MRKTRPPSKEFGFEWSVLLCVFVSAFYKICFFVGFILFKQKKKRIFRYPIWQKPKKWAEIKEDDVE